MQDAAEDEEESGAAGEWQDDKLELSQRILRVGRCRGQIQSGCLLHSRHMRFYQSFTGTGFQRIGPHVLQSREESVDAPDNQTGHRDRKRRTAPPANESRRIRFAGTPIGCCFHTLRVCRSESKIAIAGTIDCRRLDESLDVIVCYCGCPWHSPDRNRPSAGAFRRNPLGCGFLICLSNRSTERGGFRKSVRDI